MTSFEQDIKPLFRPGDRECMLKIPMQDGGNLDLHDLESVKKYATLVLLEVASGGMPMGGPEWDRQQIKLFAQWIIELYPA